MQLIYKPDLDSFLDEVTSPVYVQAQLKADAAPDNTLRYLPLLTISGFNAESRGVALVVVLGNPLTQQDINNPQHSAIVKQASDNVEQRLGELGRETRSGEVSPFPLFGVITES